MILRLPILTTKSYTYSKIYPLPNSKNLILIPPAQFHLENQEEKWTDDCRTLLNQTMCQKIKFDSTCKLKDLTKFQFAHVTNKYNLFTELTNTAILISTAYPESIMENCNFNIKKTTVQGNNILVSNCDIIIEDNVFRRPGPNYTISPPEVREEVFEHRMKIEFKQEHLQDIRKLQDEAKNLNSDSLLFNPLVQYTHYSFTSVLFLMFLLTISCLGYFRKSLYRKLHKKKNIVRISKHELQELYPKLNEVVQNTKGGGIMERPL